MRNIEQGKNSSWQAFQVEKIEDVISFNDDFQKIILDIPNISIEEQIDRYTRGLKSYICKELCTKEYNKLAEAMRDAGRIDSAHKGTFPARKPGKKPEIR